MRVTFSFRGCHYLQCVSCLFICLVFILLIFVCLSDSSFRSQLLSRRRVANMEKRRVIQSIGLIQDSNYLQQVNMSSVQGTLLKTVPGFSLLWLIKNRSDWRGAH